MISAIYTICCAISFILLLTNFINRNIIETKSTFLICIVISLTISIIPIINMIVIISYIYKKKSFN